MIPARRFSGVGLALLGGAFLGGAAPASAQIGALAAAAAAAGSGEYALAGAPIFSESGLVLTEGWAVGAFGVTQRTTYSASDGFEEFDFEFTQTNLAVGAFFAAGDRAMLGAVLNPYVSAESTVDGFSGSSSGLGNLTAFGKLALTTEGSTRVAATASVELPTGDEEVASTTSTVSVGLGASRALASDLSIHGAAEFSLLQDDEDTRNFDEGGNIFSLDGAVVKQLNPKAWLSGEVLASFSDGEYQVLLAPGARFQAGERVYIDVGLALGALSSDAIEPIDYGLAIGATLIPGR